MNNAIFNALSYYFSQETFTDVTLACDGKFYPLHKLVLSTCSEYLKNIFENTPCKHPVIVLHDIKYSELEALLSYMYSGEVSVPQSTLPLLIRAAELLQIKGLAVPDTPPSNCRTQISSESDETSPQTKRRRVDARTSASQRDFQTSRTDSPLGEDSSVHQENKQYLEHSNTSTPGSEEVQYAEQPQCSVGSAGQMQVLYSC